MSDPPRRAVIIGAGPAGLTAAYELLERTAIHPTVVERSAYMGGISRTVCHRGNRIDIGGHRFFSKSDRVMSWWQRFLPMQRLAGEGAEITYQGSSRGLSGGDGPDPEVEDRVMLLRPRKSRIYFMRTFFDYPLSMDLTTLRKLGLARAIRILASYLRAATFPIRPEENLEHFFVNRFGRELYQTFFRDYTEKVWGVPCTAISAEWGAQRVKGLSLTRAALHFLRSLLPLGRDVAQKATETSLIEQYLYPKYGPGQMWETVAEEVRGRGGSILTEAEVDHIEHRDGRIIAVGGRRRQGDRIRLEGDVFFSTMAIRDLVAALDPPAAEDVRALSDGLVYRDFITVGLLLDELLPREADGAPIRDNWIYIQEPDVRVGRLQIFNNWSPYMVADPGKTWIGLEYFCDEGDAMWSRSDAELVSLGEEEMVRIGLIAPGRVVDAVVIRMRKTYPAYFGTYGRFEELRRYLDGFENLFLVGRNGMHKYNNQDHSMLAAMTAVDNLVSGRRDKANVWEVNTEQEYHEAREG